MSRTRTKKNEIIECACEVFAERGYHLASIDEIIKRANIARGTFYLYFKNKKQIFDHIIKLLLDEIGNAVKVIELLPGSPSSEEQLKDNFRRIFTVIFNRKKFGQVLFLYSAGVDKELEEEVADFYSKMLNNITSALKLGIKYGFLRKFNVNVVASACLGIVKEIAYNLIKDESKKLNKNKLNTIADELINFSLKGIYATNNK